jgi:hypothetical protein
MCGGSPDMPEVKQKKVVEPEIDEQSEAASDEEKKRRRRAAGSRSTQAAGYQAPNTSAKTALGQ